MTKRNDSKNMLLQNYRALSHPLLFVGDLPFALSILFYLPCIENKKNSFFLLFFVLNLVISPIFIYVYIILH